MIDLHSHLLPGLDDGSKSLTESVEMARIAVDDGIEVMACTPHVLSGIYDTTATQIVSAAAALQDELRRLAIPLRLVTGADVHVAPDLVERLSTGRVLPLHASRYFLLEPPHHLAPPRFEDHLFALIRAGYVPVITHPERLTWIETGYAVFERAVARGAWLQLTAGSLTGRFGNRPRHWAERLLSEGLAHILATDSHDTRRRPPLLAEGRDAAAEIVGEAESVHLVATRPAGILRNLDPVELPAPRRLSDSVRSGSGFWQRARLRANL